MTPAAHPPLRRDTQRKWIAGVCAGIARRYGVSPLVVRAAAVVLSPSGVSIVAYVVAAIFMPDERGHRVADRRDNWTVVAFGALAILAWTTFPDMFDGNALRASLPWLVLLVGWALITRVQPEPTDRVEYGDPEATVYQDVGLDEQDSVMFEAAPTAPPPPAPTSPAPFAVAGVESPAAASRRADFARIAEPRRVRLPRSLRSPLGLVTVLLVAALVALALGLQVPLGVAWGLAIAALGAAMVFGARYGHARWLVLPAGVMTLIAAPAVDAGVHVETAEVPARLTASAGAVPNGVNGGDGDLTLDFSQLRSAKDFRANYEVYQGNITVYLPPHMKSIVTVKRAPVAAVMSGNSHQVAVVRPMAPSGSYFPDPADRAAVAEITSNPLIALSDMVKVNELLNTATYDGYVLTTGGDAGHISSNDLYNIGLNYVETPRGRDKSVRFEVDPEAEAEDGGEDESEAQAPNPDRGTLRLELSAAFGSVTVIEPLWSGKTADSVAKFAQQSCVRSGGVTGKTEPCGSIPQERQIPTCLLNPIQNTLEYAVAPGAEETLLDPSSPSADAQLPPGTPLWQSYSVADCRDVMPGGADPRGTLVTACSDGVTYLSCTALGIANRTPLKVVESIENLTGGPADVNLTVPPLSTTAPGATAPAAGQPVDPTQPITTQPITTQTITTQPTAQPQVTTSLVPTTTQGPS